jgi:hypothetical protein
MRMASSLRSTGQCRSNSPLAGLPGFVTMLVAGAAVGLGACGADELAPVASTASSEGQYCNASRVILAHQEVMPTDILWVVDTSHSMAEESQTVQDNINLFSQRIAASGIDYRVILIADATQIQVPPPLGTSEKFLHVNRAITSHSALVDILGQYSIYQAMLRADSVKHIVVVSDDNSSLSADAFVTQLEQLTTPGFAPTWLFHSIVAFGDQLGVGCDSGAAVGQEYLTLSQMTGGVVASVCEPDWDPIFSAIEAAVESASIPCTFAVPEMPQGTVIDPSVAELVAQDASGEITVIPRVQGPNACASGGWYFDNPVLPSVFVACDTTCDALRANQDVAVRATVGCLSGG